MKKSLYSFGIAAALATCALSAQADPGFYIGGGFLSGSGELEDSTATPTRSYDNDTSGQSFKLGYITSGGNRLELSYSAIDTKFSLPVIVDKLTGFDIDYLFTFGSDALKPYLGVGIGAYTFEDTAQYFTDKKDLTGVSLNLSAGLTYEVVSNVEVEAALRLKSLESEDIQFMGMTGSFNQTMTNLYLGANLKF